MSWHSTALTWLILRWPREVTPDHLTAAARMLASSGGSPLILQATGTSSGVDHHLAVRSAHAGLVADHLRAALSGLSVVEVDADTAREQQPVLNRAICLHLTSRRRPLRTDHAEDLTRTLLTALTHVGRGERLVLQWLLGPTLQPMVVPTRSPGMHPGGWSNALVRAAWSAPQPPDSQARTALRTKQGEPGWLAVGRVAVCAASPGRQERLLRQVLSALRGAHGPGVRFRAERDKPSRVSSAVVPWRWSMTLNTSELLAVSSWPVGLTAELPVSSVSSRALAPDRIIPSRGRVLGVASMPGAERPVALSPSDSLRHLHVLGPTGVGKSTLLLNLITQDMAAGRGVVVVEPKGDLISEVLRRVPEDRMSDVVLLDPTDDDRPVGLNPLHAAGRSPELVADQLLAVFHGLYADFWGPRTQDILHAGLLTLARSPHATLVALPRLLSDQSFRRTVVGGLHDPIGLGPFWSGFEAWSDAERTAAIAPVMNKLRPFLLRPQLRRVIGQVTPKLDLRQALQERKILLVSLRKGLMGPEASSLLGSLVVAGLWQATLERADLPAAKRAPMLIYVDEFQDYLHLPTDLSDALAEARGLGVGLTLAHQYLHQLPLGMRSAVLTNARSRVCFQLAHEDAKVFAATDRRLQPEDFSSLGLYETYASLLAGGSVQPWCSLRTQAPSASTCDEQIVRAASRERYGTDRRDIDAELQPVVGGTKARVTDASDLAPRKRTSGGRA